MFEYSLRQMNLPHTSPLVMSCQSGNPQLNQIFKATLINELVQEIMK